MTQTNTNDDQKGSGAQRALLIVVVGMGFALVGGAALLIGKIVNKSKECTLTELTLPAGAQVLGASDDAVQVMVSAEDGSQSLQRYELCRGTMTGEVTLKQALSR